jgi:hypothetical protein
MAQKSNDDDTTLLLIITTTSATTVTTKTTDNNHNYSNNNKESYINAVLIYYSCHYHISYRHMRLLSADTFYRVKNMSLLQIKIRR